MTSYATLCKYNRGNAGRVYFYDIDTREELELAGQSGLSFLGACVEGMS